MTFLDEGGRHMLRTQMAIRFPEALARLDALDSQIKIAKFNARVIENIKDGLYIPKRLDAGQVQHEDGEELRRMGIEVIMGAKAAYDKVTELLRGLHKARTWPGGT